MKTGQQYEYSLSENESTLSGNSPSKQLIRIVDITAKGVTVEFKAGEHWLLGRPIDHSSIDRLFTDRNMVQVWVEEETASPQDVEAVDNEALPTLPDKDILIESIRSAGSLFTSELAKCLGKPVAATNSVLSTMRNSGLVKSVKETSGIKWSLV